MARRDYIPTADSELTLWLESFRTQLATRLVTFGMVSNDLLGLNATATTFDALLTQARTKAGEAQAATAAKRQARKLALQAVRPLVRRLQAHAMMTDELRAVLGLTLRNAPSTTTRTDPVPDVAPLIELDFGTRGQITIHFGPNPAERNRNGLPDGALGAVVQAAPVTVQQATNPDAIAGWQWLDNTTRSPLVHTPDVVGPRTWAYRVAYLYRRGKHGPWSAPATASVTV
jgi:hypothetical protein